MDLGSNNTSEIGWIDLADYWGKKVGEIFSEIPNVGLHCLETEGQFLSMLVVYRIKSVYRVDLQS